jgi:hypothetical protein
MDGPMPVFGRPPLFFASFAIAPALGFCYRIAYRANRSKAGTSPRL